MKSSGDNNPIKKQTVSSCRVIFLLILNLCGLACSGCFLAFWITKSTSGFISNPYVVSTCSQNYFQLKYQSNTIALIIFLSICVVIFSQSIQLIMNILMLVKKQSISGKILITLAILSSIILVSLVVPAGYSISFMVEFSKAKSYGCYFSYSNSTIYLLTGLSNASLILTLVSYIIIVAYVRSINPAQVKNGLIDVREQSQIQLLQNAANNQSDNIFAPDIYYGQKLPNKYDQTSRKRHMRVQSSRKQSQSFVEIRTPKSTAKNTKTLQVQKRAPSFSRPKERVNSSAATNHKQRNKQDIWSQESHLKQTSMEPIKIKQKPKVFFKQISQDWNTRDFELVEAQPYTQQQYFVPKQAFSYSRSNKTPISSSYQNKIGTISLDRAQMKEMRQGMNEGQFFNSRAKKVGQIRKNYERKLNSEQSWI